MRFGIHGDKTRMVLDMDAPADFSTFMLSDPYRMVIDLPAFEWRAGEVQSPQMAGVLATRHGNLKDGISRIVFDMNRPVSIQQAFTLPSGSGKPNRLVIDFANASPQIFAQTQNKIFGTLDSGAQTVSESTAPPSPPPPPSSKKPLIIIDPGHGGIDPGAIGTDNLREKDIVLKIAKELKKQLEASGQYNVKMTREDDKFIKLADRVKFARKHSGDLFVSIHADSMPKSTAHGASIYTLSEKASDAQTARLAARENKADLIAGIDLNVEDKDVVNILMDLAMRDTMNQSKFFANTVVANMQANKVETLQTPHRSAGFAVLKAPDIPSVLVESGFMSNPSEVRALNSEPYRRKLAATLKDGIDTYFDQVRKNQRL